MWNLPDPTIAHHRNALDRAACAIEESKSIRQQLASLELRSQTLLGVAAQSSPVQLGLAHITAATLGARPNGRY